MSWSRPRTVGELGLCGSLGDDFTWRADRPGDWPPPAAAPYEATAGGGVNATRPGDSRGPSGTEAVPMAGASTSPPRGCAPTSGTHTGGRS